MRNIYLIIVIVIGAAFTLIAQSVPQGMNYQAVARDLSGIILADQPISLKVTLLSQNERLDQVEEYTEIHRLITNKLGLFTLTIGQGEVSFGDFREVPWSSGDIWMEVAIDSKGGDNFEVLNNTRLLSVPFAFHSATASDIVSDDNKAGLAVAKKEWMTKGNANLDPTKHKLGTTDSAPLIFVTDDIERGRIKENGDFEIAKDFEVSGDIIANMFTGDGSGLTGINVDDADADPANELQN